MWVSLSLQIQRRIEDATAAWVGSLLMCQPTLSVQLLETLLLAMAFGVILPASTRFFSKVFRTRPWYDHTAGIFREMMEKGMGIEMTDEMIEKAMGQNIPIMSQHLLGGILCLPAIFGLGVPRAAALALARHGALVELGWELQDTAERLYERCCTPNGHVTQPNGLFFFLMMHHAMQWALVIPMNLYYSELSGYHELIFLLEGASGSAALIGFYGFTLDISKKKELLQMIVLNAMGFVIMVYSRFVHYWWSLFKCLSHFYAEGAMVVLAVGFVCGVVLMPFVAFSFIPQQWKKLVKFIQMYRERDDGRCDSDEFPRLLASEKPDVASRKSAGKAHVE